MNSFTALGRLTADPQQGDGGKNRSIYAKFCIANQQGKDKPPLYLDCVAFGKTAEIVLQHLTKGSQVLIFGQLEPNNYTNKDGVEIKRVTLKVGQIQFTAGGKNEGQNEAVTPRNATPARLTKYDVDDGDIPF